MGTISLLSTDFDGTLTSQEDAGRCVPHLGGALEEARGGGALWVINTGRSLGHAVEGIREFRGPFPPDFLICNERHIYAKGRGNPFSAEAWLPMGDWNAVCDAKHGELYENARPVFAELRRWLAAGRRVGFWPPEGAPEGLVAEDEEAMDRAVRFLETLRRGHPEFSYQRNSVYLRFCHLDYHKGSALSQLAREIGVETEAVLAAGDNHNDLQMLDPEHAGLLVCPANSIPEVRDKVASSSARGYLAERPFGAGTGEGIFYFLQNHEA